MISDDLKLMDETIAMIRAKNDEAGSFNKESLYKFEFNLFLSLDIVRFELLLTNRISDLTGDAISQLFSFQCFEYYYRDYNSIYKKCSELSYALAKYNNKLRTHDLKSKIGMENNNWIKYFKTAISNLINSKSDS